MNESRDYERLYRGVLVVDVRDGPAVGALRGCTGSRRIRGREVPVGGDVIVGLDGSAVRSHQALMAHLLLETEPGEPVALDLLREGVRVSETITLGERPDPERGERSRGERGWHVPVE